MAQQGGRTDEYGNPVHQTGTGAHGQGMGTTGGTGGIFGGGTGGEHVQHHGGGEHVKHQGGGGVLHRSGSSSSSSSEDDGIGGRRKKGLKEKVKDKLPGAHKTDTTTIPGSGPGYGAGQPGQHVPGYGAGQHGPGYGGEHPPEKKGVMEKIKEKLPGGNQPHHP